MITLRYGGFVRKTTKVKFYFHLHFISRVDLSISLIADDVNLDHLAEVRFARILYWKVTLSPLWKNATYEVG